MAERPGTRLRPTGMWMRLLGLVVVLPLLAAGCGDEGATSTDPGSPATASASGCATGAVPADPPVAELDLDGDGTPEAVGYVRADGSCPPRLVSTVAGQDLVATVDSELPVRPADAAAIELPDRVGQVLLVSVHHPRGGFQAYLFGVADGRFEELRAGGEPIFGFVATDTLSSPVAAHCVGDGFDVVEARAHQPIGVAPAWDVYRTTYSVDGNDVTKSDTVEVADNVLDRRLQQEYGDLVDHALFENCRVGS